MKINHLFKSLLFLGFGLAKLYAQNMSDYNGGWESTISDTESFHLSVSLIMENNNEGRFKISNRKASISQYFKTRDGENFKIEVAPNLNFEGYRSDNGKTINGFMKSGILLYHLKLEQVGDGRYSGFWNILMLETLSSPNLYLSIENGNEDQFEAYPIFDDTRFTGTWCANFRKEKDSLYFDDFKTGLKFKGKLRDDCIDMGIYLGNSQVEQVKFQKSNENWNIQPSKKRTKTEIKNSLDLVSLERAIEIGELPNTESVLVSQNNKLVYEAYFAGFTANIPHDQRSASKSISSAVVGLTIKEGFLKNEKAKLFDFIPEHYQQFNDSLKQQIDIESLLTMSSGLDAIDFGIKRNSLASENQYQRTPDWTETVLKAPMLYASNLHANYGSANPYLLGLVVDSVIPTSVELFMDKKLFQPLAISNYIIQTDLKGRPYFGGGMYLIPRDMLKFGQLYQNNGQWKGSQIISKNWVKRSFENYRVLENTQDKNGYGYLWWHHHYTIGSQTIKTIEARGAGGQYIFVIPSLKATVVITSGNYRNDKTQQPEKILEQFILPKLLN